MQHEKNRRDLKIKNQPMTKHILRNTNSQICLITSRLRSSNSSSLFPRDQVTSQLTLLVSQPCFRLSFVSFWRWPVAKPALGYYKQNHLHFPRHTNCLLKNTRVTFSFFVTDLLSIVIILAHFWGSRTPCQCWVKKIPWNCITSKFYSCSVIYLNAVISEG